MINTTESRTYSMDIALALRNKANNDYNNDTFHVIGRIANDSFHCGNIAVDFNDYHVGSLSIDAIRPDNHYNRSIARKIDNDLYGHCNYVSGLHVKNPNVPSIIERDYVCAPRYRRAPVALNASQHQFHSDGNALPGDRPEQVSNPVTNTMTEYYSKKQKYAGSRKAQGYSDLLSLASTDSVIAILERQLSQDDKGICIRENTCAISNLSQLWRAKKRQNDDNRDYTIYNNDGKEVDPLELIAINAHDNDLALSCQKILKKQDPVFSQILDLYLQGNTQSEIADKIGKSLITIKRLFKHLASFLAPLTDDIADYIRKQGAAPPYAW